LEGGTTEFKCERKKKREEAKNNTVEDIGAKDTGRHDLLTCKYGVSSPQNEKSVINYTLMSFPIRLLFIFETQINLKKKNEI